MKIFYSTTEVKHYLNSALAYLNNKYDEEIVLHFDDAISFDETCFSDNTIHFGCKDLDFSPEAKHTYPKMLLYLQFLTHEFFHPILDKEIEQDPLKDILLTTDWLLAEVSHSFYDRNHTFSLVEIEVEKRSWEEMYTLAPEVLNVTNIFLEARLCELFSSKDNEFFTELDPNLIERILMKTPLSDSFHIESFLKELDGLSRETTREFHLTDFPREISVKIPSFEEDPLKLNSEILDLLLSYEGSDPQIHGLKDMVYNLVPEQTIIKILHPSIDPEPDILER